MPTMAVRKRDSSRATAAPSADWTAAKLTEASKQVPWPLTGLQRALSKCRLAASGEGPATQPRATKQAKAPGSKNPKLCAKSFTAGAAAFGTLAFIAGAYPWALPWVLVAFTAVGLPCRIYDFATADNGLNFFFLLDFCYWVNTATALYLLLPSLHDARLEASLYALADGPVACALVVWQCAWVFSSPDHTLSVLIHLLPGLAMYAQHHLPRLGSLEQLWACLPRLKVASTALELNSCIAATAPARAPAAGTLEHPAAWLLAAPLAFYAAWQLVYFLVVQVLCCNFIRRHNLDTSYRYLARRAKRANNVWARLVLRGSTARRLLWYGLLQLAFTLVTLLAFIPTYYSFHLAFAWQALKFGLPLHHGAKYLCERHVKAAIAEGIKEYHLTADARPGAAPLASKAVS